MKQTLWNLAVLAGAATMMGLAAYVVVRGLAGLFT
jgi:hypothetical protein